MQALVTREKRVPETPPNVFFFPLLPSDTPHQLLLPLLLLLLSAQPLRPQLLNRLLPILLLRPLASTRGIPTLQFAFAAAAAAACDRTGKVPRSLHPLPRNAVPEPVLLIVGAHDPNALLLPPLFPVVRVSAAAGLRLPGEALEEVDVASAGWGGVGLVVGGEAAGATEAVEAELGFASAGLLALQLLFAGGGLLIFPDLLPVIEVVDVPPLLGEDVEAAMAAHLDDEGI